MGVAVGCGVGADAVQAAVRRTVRIIKYLIVLVFISPPPRKMAVIRSILDAIIT